MLQQILVSIVLCLIIKMKVVRHLANLVQVERLQEEKEQIQKKDALVS